MEFTFYSPGTNLLTCSSKCLNILPDILSQNTEGMLEMAIHLTLVV